MTVGTFAVILGGSRTEDTNLAFRVKVSTRNSPLLYLVEVIEERQAENHIKLRWWAPNDDAYAVPRTRRVTMEQCCQPGFATHDRGMEEWSAFVDPDEKATGDVDVVISHADVVMSWDADESVGHIPDSKYAHLINRLKALS
mmetsp:Transcript_14965/g.18064  ORF Transcript_14965/g.18064 Transcript_14965/m.18064 type:complete len:142 (+) Transcript_14965:3-428(+)